jgi:hypothetical protein
MRSRTLSARCLSAAVACGALLWSPDDAGAAVRWRTLATSADQGEICLTVEGRAVEYKRLDREDPVVIRVRGPRRLKFLCRYLYEPGETGRREYTLHVALDGEHVLSKVFTGSARDDVFRCGEESAVAGGLRRAYLNVDDGWHELEVTAVAAAQRGAVAARFFRESRRQREERVSYAPERYAGVTHLQFESGARSTYYCFTPDQPLACEVTGPTTLTVWTRLDFDHTMSGSQPYTLEAAIDGEPWRTFHYDTEKLDAAVYTDRSDVLPGQRKTLRVPLDRGRHRVEIRCVRPAGCCIAAKIRIPAKDVR